MQISIVYTKYQHSKTCLKLSLKKIPKHVFKTDNHSMQVKSTAECSSEAYCNTLDLH